MISMAVLVLGLILSGPAGQDARAEAERLARAGAREEALKRFQALAAANPDDVAARLWIARLHLEMNHPQRAAAVYESIVATDPRNVDALVGLGDALTRTGRFGAASDALSRAESLAADRMDVLSAQGALHAAAGRTTLALAYYGRALALDPSNTAARKAEAAIRAARAHRIELDYDFQTFNTLRDDTHTGAITGNFRVSDALRVFGKAQVHEGAFDTEVRGGGGLEWMANHKVSLRAGALFGGNTAELPSADAFAAASVRQGRVTWRFEVRDVDFDGANVLLAGPGLAVRLTPRTTAFALYQRGRTSFDLGASTTTSDNLTLGLTGSLTPRTRVFAEYRHGIDRLDWLTLDRIDASDANTVAFGGRIDLTPFVGVDGGYDYQSRAFDERVQRAHARFVFRF